MDGWWDTEWKEKELVSNEHGDLYLLRQECSNIVLTWTFSFVGHGFDVVDGCPRSRRSHVCYS